MVRLVGEVELLADQGDPQGSAEPRVGPRAIGEAKRALAAGPSAYPATPEPASVETWPAAILAGASLAELEERLTSTLREGRWNRERLRAMAVAYGTKVTLALVERCLNEAGPDLEGAGLSAAAPPGC